MQLKHLRDEATRNIDYRYKAEQELDRVRVESHRDQLRPHMMDLSSAIAQPQNQPQRRSMMMNGYEKIFFGQSQQGIAPMPQSTRGAQERQGGPFDFQNFRNQMAGPNTATVVMPMNYEGAGTLKNESVFVSVANNKDFLPSLR